MRGALTEMLGSLGGHSRMVEAACGLGQRPLAPPHSPRTSGVTVCSCSPRVIYDLLPLVAGGSGSSLSPVSEGPQQGDPEQRQRHQGPGRRGSVGRRRGSGVHTTTSLPCSG